MSSPQRQYAERMALLADDYIQERLGWSGYGADQSKGIPYAGDQNMVFTLQRVGCYLYNSCPTIRSAVEKFISFVVGSGHTYDVSLRENVPKNGLTVDDSTLDMVRWAVQWTQENCYPDGWLALQEESIRRYLREGEVFRHKFTSANGLQVRFIEPYQIQQKPGSNVPGEFGIVKSEGDATQVKSYWYLRNPSLGSSEQNFESLSATKVQHLKYGVDGNDPRGISPFPMVTCHSKRIKLIDMAMVELALTQSSYAVVRQYDNVVSATEMRRIAEGFRAGDTNEAGERQFGKEVDAKGFTLDFPHASVDPANFIAIIDQEKCFIAGVLDMPDFVLLSSSGGGSRASNVAAEGPFARRIAREQVKLGILDVELLWSAVGSLMNWTDRQVIEYRKHIQINPSFPVAYTRDILKDTQAVKLQVEGKFLSRQGAAEKLQNNWPATLRELEDEEQNPILVPPAPEPAVSANKPIAKKTKKTPAPTAGSARG